MPFYDEARSEQVGDGLSFVLTPSSIGKVVEGGRSGGATVKGRGLSGVRRER